MKTTIIACYNQQVQNDETIEHQKKMVIAVEHKQFRQQNQINEYAKEVNCLLKTIQTKEREINLMQKQVNELHAQLNLNI